MKLIFLSDFHLGFSQSGREKEAFEQALQAMKQALLEKPDAIVLCGDLFNEAVPAQEQWLEAFKLLSFPKKAPISEMKILKQKHSEKEQESQKEQEKQLVSFSGIPIISIHGTHEFRGKDFKNALQVLEAAGFIIYLHGEKAFLQKDTGDDTETVIVHGMGGVPEKKAFDVLQAFNPKPIQKACNILLLHQSFKEFLPFDDEMTATLSLTDLPEGFDLCVNGHLHWSSELNENNRHLLVTGSTVITQMKRLEAEKKKGFFLFDTKTKQLQFKEIFPQRIFYYKKFSFQNASLQKVKEEVQAYLGMLSFAENPLIKIKLTGSLEKGFSSADLKEEDLLEGFSEKAIFSVSKSFSKDDFKLKIQHLSELQKSKQSIISFGLEMLEKNLSDTSFNNAFDVQRIFSLLEEGENDKVIELLLKEKN